MSKRTRKPSGGGKPIRPGSSRDDAGTVGGDGDFGVPEKDVIERDYTSENTRRSDPGAARTRPGSQGRRDSGAGADDAGPGSSSGGDFDIETDSLVGESKPTGEDEKQNTRGKRSRGSAARGPAGVVGQPPDDRTAGPEGGDAAFDPAASDESAGEISADEASGRNDSRS